MKQDTNTPTALALFSGGLDSILACRTIMAQNIRVQAVKFVTPFYDYGLLADEKGYRQRIRETYGIEVEVRDVSEKFLALLHAPPHGFGKNFNPCVDCKILLASEARKLLPDYRASFIITGEVLGQRPMSQRRDTLRIIERDSGCEGILLRPLCARNLEPTTPELEGLVDRELLLDFSGRTRTPQMELAKRFGITDYPSPAGGCMLTDPILGQRLRRFYAEQAEVTVAGLRMLLVGRHFRLPRQGLLTMGRNQGENERLGSLVQAADWVLIPADRPGPTGVLQYSDHPADLEAAARLVARYSKKKPEGPAAVPVTANRGAETVLLPAAPLSDEVSRDWVR